MQLLTLFGSFHAHANSLYQFLKIINQVEGRGGILVSPLYETMVLIKMYPTDTHSLNVHMSIDRWHIYGGHCVFTRPNSNQLGRE